MHGQYAAAQISLPRPKFVEEPECSEQGRAKLQAFNQGFNIGRCGESQQQTAGLGGAGSMVSTAHVTCWLNTAEAARASGTI